ncbi:GNAT family N-acetyltransferase [Kribbella sp. GL6]|uniref:GNAT family N-acetyltransferase n=1 Tax=Kribbella sp. GL6 TaxID=3419765 RepID=UPI003D04253E
MIETYAEVPGPLRRQIQALQDEAWPSPPTDGPVHDPALQPLSMVLVEDGVVLAALDILRKQIEHAGNTFQAGGLSTVVTRADRRRQGHGHRLVSAARTTMIDEHLDLGLFTCDAPLLPFYESAGWQHLPGTTLIGGTPNAPFPSDQPGFNKLTLAAFFTPAAQQAAATFRQARIALYPGQIDKLW